MATFMDLPTELLMHICIYVDPEEIFSFSAINQRIHEVSKPIVAKHKALRAKFSSIKDDPYMAFWFWHNLCRSFLTGSPGNAYVRHIDTGMLEQRKQNDAWQPQNEPSAFIKDWDPENDCEKLIPFVTLGNTFQERENPFLKTNKSLSYWEPFRVAIETEPETALRDRARDMKLLRNGDESMIRSLLLPLLPNLRTLRIRTFDSQPAADGLYINPSRLEKVVWRAAVAHTAPNGSHGPRSFGRLTSVELMQNDDNWPCSFTFLRCLAALPSMRKLSANGLLDCCYFLRHRKLPPSNVIDLTLLEHQLCPIILASFLAGGAPLRRFRCTASRLVEPDSTMRDTITVLLENARDSLEALELSLDEHCLVCRTSSDSVSLCGFSRLKELTMDHDVLDLDLRLRPDMADVLPPSLEKLVLRSFRRPASLPRNLLRMLDAGVGHGFPKLAQLDARKLLNQSQRTELVKACRARGIRWISRPREQGGDGRS